MFCRKCGTQIPDDSDFCPRCGARNAIDVEVSGVDLSKTPQGNSVSDRYRNEPAVPPEQPSVQQTIITPPPQVIIKEERIIVHEEKKDDTSSGCSWIIWAIIILGIIGELGSCAACSGCTC